MTAHRFGMLAALAGCASTAAYSGEAPPEPRFDKSFQIPRLESAPRIDGRLDDEQWQRAVLVDDLHQISPVEYSKPAQRTEIRLLYTRDALYIGARMFDDPAKVTAHTLKQGGSIFADDYIGFSIDPYLDRRNGYMFNLNPNGVRFDAIFKNIDGFESNWDGIWQGEAQIDGQGWTAEIALPFSTLSFNPATSTWGFNFERWIARNSEWIGWVTRERQMNPSINGTATGLAGLRQGLGLDVVPAATTRAEKRFTPGSHSTQEIEPSLDVFYKITPQLNASLTVNTDFSATDVDTRQVNLSRFSLFFPEKRNFFLRDADIFEFGGLSTNGRPFFSRRIGLNRFGRPIDIDYGGKVSGRAGRLNLGSLYIRQGSDPETGIGARDIFVGRATANVLAESRVGAILTHGDPQSGRDNTVYGADFSLRNSHLRGGKIVALDGWYQRADSAGLQGGEGAWGLALEAPNNTGWNGYAAWKRVGRNFQPALGFVNRAGIDDYILDTGYRWRFGGERPVRSLQALAHYYRTDTLADGRLSSSSAGIGFNGENHSGDNLYLGVDQNREVLPTAFGIYRSSDGLRRVAIPTGDYRYVEAIAELNTNGARRISGRVLVNGGEYYDGTHMQGLVALTWKPNRHVNTTVSYSEDHISLPGGDFTVSLMSAGATVAFDSHWSWTSLAQYDNVSEVLGLNSRLHWQPQAGRNAYLVVNYGQQDYDRDNRFRSLNWDISLKYSHTLRF